MKTGGRGTISVFLLIGIAVAHCDNNGGNGNPDADSDRGSDSGRDASSDASSDGSFDTDPDVSSDASVDGEASTDADTDQSFVPEAPITVIPVSGPLAESRIECSGLAWYGDHLIVLPQYPRLFPEGGHGSLFGLHRDDILAFLDGSVETPLEPIRIPLDDSVLDTTLDVDLFEGFEAIAFDGDQAYLAIEAWTTEGHMGFVVTASVEPSLNIVTVTETPPVPIASQSGVNNMAEEAIIATLDGVVSLHEANGALVNDSPSAHVFDRALSPLRVIPIPSMEYRITDATALDGEDRFWVMNFFFPGDTALRPDGDDPLVTQYGVGQTHAERSHVERLVEFQIEADRITRTEEPPIQLELVEDSRNWEGLVRLGEEGFLVMTDEFPETILAFISTEEMGSIGP